MSSGLNTAGYCRRRIPTLSSSPTAMNDPLHKTKMLSPENRRRHLSDHRYHWIIFGGDRCLWICQASAVGRQATLHLRFSLSLAFISVSLFYSQKCV
ncbi:hypothetical protein Hanom_Chr10g00951661 [Helianthus anomalus]